MSHHRQERDINVHLPAKESGTFSFKRKALTLDELALLALNMAEKRRFGGNAATLAAAPMHRTAIRKHLHKTMWTTCDYHVIAPTPAGGRELAAAIRLLAIGCAPAAQAQKKAAPVSRSRPLNHAVIGRS